MRHRSSSALRAAAAAALLLAAACSDQLTTPDGAAPSAPRASVDAATGRPVLHPNRTRYRYHGQRPATGRSGSAQLTMQALVGRDGVTEVALSTGQVDAPWEPAHGSIARVLTKASSPDGEHLFTRNHNDLSGGGSASLALPGLARGSALEVQANVTGIDASRTGVVTVTGTVHRRPNLAVAALSAPSRVRSGTPTNIAATIRETNGDTGNWSVCTLYVDGRPVDWSHWIWVDAGDGVTCAFTHVFEGEGTRRLEVRVETPQGAPRDDNPDDNSATAVLESFTVGEIFYQVWASHASVRDSIVFDQRLWNDSFETEAHDGRFESSQYQRVSLHGWFDRAVSPSPVTLEVDEITDGTTLYASTYELTPSDIWSDGGFCSYGGNSASNARVYLCSIPEVDATTFSYERYTESVTYHSYQYSRTWDKLTGEEYVYSYNVSWDDAYTFPPFGDDFAMRIRLHADGALFSADPAFPLLLHETRYAWPYACYTSEDVYWNYFTEYCSASLFHQREVSGGAYKDG